MTHYFNPSDPLALRHFTKTLSSLLEKEDLTNRDIVILCIGSDRATGDSLGPMVGHQLARIQKNFHLYGTLKNPVHAKNLEDALTFIELNHKNPFIIAIDASLGVARTHRLYHIRRGLPRAGRRRCQKTSCRRRSVHHRHRQSFGLWRADVAPDHKA